MRRATGAVLLAALGLGCAPVRAPAPRAAASVPTRVALALRGVDGLSDLTTDGAGLHWAIAERDRALVAIAEDQVQRVVPIEGVDDALDTESLAWIGDGRFLVGTESMDPARAADRVLELAVTDDVARVVGEAPPYGPPGVALAPNKDIEGLCAAGGTLLAAVETVLEQGGARWALVGRRPLPAAASEPWETFRVRLTSPTGKLSALSCRAADERLEVVAIERHYQVARIVRFELPATGPGRDVTARVTRDLSHALRGKPNLEGLTPDGRDLLLVVDNHHGERTGPNELVRVPPPF